MDQITSSGGKVTLIHFTYLNDGSDSDWRIACMPNMTEFHATPYHPNYQRTNDPRAVTCPTCKRTLVFKTAEEVLNRGIKEPTRGKK